MLLGGGAAAGKRTASASGMGGAAVDGRDRALSKSSERSRWPVYASRRKLRVSVAFASERCGSEALAFALAVVVSTSVRVAGPFTPAAEGAAAARAIEGAAGVFAAA